MTELEFKPRYYEAALDDSIPVHMLCNYLQEGAGQDANNLSFGREQIGEHGVAWVLSRMQIELINKAVLGKKLKVKTWPSFSEKIISRREYIITDEDGKIILKCSSWWLILNLNTRKITRIPQHMLDLNTEKPDFMVEEGNFKLKTPQDAKPVFSKDFLVRLEDIDCNGHVNNTHYIAWAIETLPAEVVKNKTIKSLRINFKSECIDGNKIKSFVYDNGNSEYIHELVREDDGKEVFRLVSNWQ
ncbi:Acyl-ACP thioesterase [Elusimicrobium minutum Pei191]|uniref:Acyl-ACP thioesterase n=1 Tax=Elusimicrobium minutum (strain Pei191) TaxID=445932 RepID=B2KDV9_ELUMP|nr:acyl-ACP thioesterase domain-containing protein [Elusimicrobium minutum]ACC98705.1 Acyl-ACP thioesterase [Elusimicrobium minutum Pei191]